MNRKHIGNEWGKHKKNNGNEYEQHWTRAKGGRRFRANTHPTRMGDPQTRMAAPLTTIGVSPPASTADFPPARMANWEAKL